MTRRRAMAVAAAALVGAALAAAAARLLLDPRPPASRIAFSADGTDLSATDVQSAVRELSAKLRAVESSQAQLRSGAAAQERQLAAAQVAGVGHEVRLQGQEDRLGALEARVAEATSARRRIDYADGAGTTSVGPAYARLRDLGTFAKQHAGSAVTLTWSTHLDALGDPGTFCDFQLRIDGKPDVEKDGGGGRAVVYVPAGQQGGSAAASASALFGRVGAGSHTVSAWVRGSARECQENYGNFPRSVLVEEGPRLP